MPSPGTTASFITWYFLSGSGQTLTSRGTLDVVGISVGVHPAHQPAQLAAGLLDRVLLGPFPQRVELRGTGVLVGDEPGRERPAADVGQHGLHVLLDVLVDHPRPADVVAVFGGVRHRPALLGYAALVHQVDYQLQLVQAFEVGD